MTDKVQKIREEVERLRDIHQMKYQQLDTNDNMCLVECDKRNLCNELLLFIDSLQEDTPSLTQVNSTPSQTEGGRGVCSQQEEFSIVIVLNGQRHRQVLHKGCFSKKECKEKCSLYERCQRCCIDLCMIFFHDPHCHFIEEPVSEDFEKEVRKYASIYYKDNDISKLARHFANWQKNKMTTLGWKRATEELNIGCIIWDESRHLHLYSDIVTKGQLYISMADILSLPGSPKENEG